MRLKLLATTLSALAVAASSAGLAHAATTSQPAGDGGQWGLDQVDGTRDGVYHYNATGAGVSVYVLDTGVDAGHPDLNGRVRSGFDAVDSSGNGQIGCYPHGTHMAGLVGGEQYGVAKDVTIVPVRVQECNYTSALRYYLAGIQWMIQDHVKGTPAVANMSFDENYGDSTALDDAVQAAIDDGITVVVAAGNVSEGNGGDSCLVSPARNGNAIRVGGAQQGNGGTTTWYTGGNPGNCTDILAPAYNITSDVPGGGTAMMSGTSQATALTSGAAALVLQQHPTWSPAQVKAQLLGTATQDAVDGVPDGVPNRLLNALAATTGGTSAPAPQPTAPAPQPTAPAPQPTAPAPQPPATSTQPTFRVAWAPRITGTAVLGNLIGTDQGGWIPGAQTKSVRWYRVGATRQLVGSTSSYRVQGADVGSRLQVCVTADRAGYASMTSCSTTSAVVPAPAITMASAPVLAGSTQVLGTVRVVSSFGPAPVGLTYQWYKVNGAGRYTLLAGSGSSRTNLWADAGYHLRVKVTASRAGYPTRTVWSGLSAPIHH